MTINMAEDSQSTLEGRFFKGETRATKIGTGTIGGKASGLCFIQTALSREFNSQDSEIKVSIPSMAVIATDYFDKFMSLNGLYEVALSKSADEIIASAFLKANLPSELVEELQALAVEVQVPLAVRSSSLMEDDLNHPFAGVYATKMIPNNQSDAKERFLKICDAVKFVYASTYFENARRYVESLGKTMADEKMAVIIQKIVGHHHGENYYPDISGVARSYNYYSRGHARAEDGVVILALGLGKAIVDSDSATWSYAPTFPKSPPPFNNPVDMLQNTQKGFWSVNMGELPVCNPALETEYMSWRNLESAEIEGSLKFVASTFDVNSNRVIDGIGEKGPRLINFAPILTANDVPLNERISELLKLCREEHSSDVEIEFAVTLDAENGLPASIGLLQVRQMLVAEGDFEVLPSSLSDDDVVVASDMVMGNGETDAIEDIVYLCPEKFDSRETIEIAREVTEVNDRLVSEGRNYILMGFGRWGTSHRWMGIPVVWSQIAGAKAIVEIENDEMSTELTQGSHFFHNMTSFNVKFLSVPKSSGLEVNWEWLKSQPIVSELHFVRHIRCNKPVKAVIDGKSGLGMITNVARKMEKRRSAKSEPQRGNLLLKLLERQKELTCLYAVEEVLRDSKASLSKVMTELTRVIPDGWQHPDICRAKITIEEDEYGRDESTDSFDTLHADIFVQGARVGTIYVYYIDDHEFDALDSYETAFLAEETKLLNAIADRIGNFLLHQRLDTLEKSNNEKNVDQEERRESGWRSALRFLQTTDEALYLRISKRMVTHLSLSGISEASSIMQRYSEDKRVENILAESNEPRKKQSKEGILQLCSETFKLAARKIRDGEILDIVQKWIREDKSSYLVKPLADMLTPLSHVADAMKRFQLHATSDEMLSKAARANVVVALIQRFLSDQLQYVTVAKHFVGLEYFFDLIDRIVAPDESLGKLGGKTAGLILGERILRDRRPSLPEIGMVKIPKSWHITSDGLMDFLHYNEIEGVQEAKYKPIAEVRLDYPHIIEVFKNSHFSRKMLKGLTMALDDFGDNPIVVRSSSLLEDRLGSAFSGKYKSLFLANQGDRNTRLEALTDAISEVYASTFGPDAIEYRSERGLLDFSEEMGILIQEVIGKKIGKYFFPAYAGVAFSRNEFRWSPRIKREDGLVRIVPGLGTRAVDRLGDDYPVLASPGQPGLRVNVSIDETIRYAPKFMDIINLETNRFETKPFTEIVKEVGSDYPAISQIVSVYKDRTLRKPILLTTDFSTDDIIPTFNGLLSDSPFLEKINAILNCLEKMIDSPVDIEFASDGDNFYLLQCRPQSSSDDDSSATIPNGTPVDDIVFSANKYISNGRVPDLSHLVYVVPEAYSELSEVKDMPAVGKAVGLLNKLLPKRKFMLMGPGRWGSRGDIKLGVRVTYSDINNSAMLIEIARKKGNYIPDLSFGTHFFQDLVEASIRYLPLYPDDKGIHFNEEFLMSSNNILGQILPEFGYLRNVIRVIDIKKSTYGKVLRVLMNADSNAALGFICEPQTPVTYMTVTSGKTAIPDAENHWQWRTKMAERIGQQLSDRDFAVKALYIFGSTKNANSGPASDIDLLIHFEGNEDQKKKLLIWLDGWSLALDEMNYLRTGQRCNGLLDVHIITDEDIKTRNSYAIKIGAVTDAAVEIPIGKS
jgi:predicted nucleotidyltransferase